VGIGYAGHVNDLSTGLSYQQQRYYDPLLGRFITADPVVSDMNSGGNFNRYWYANNSPYRYRDPDGRFAGIAVGIGVEIAYQMTVGGRSIGNLDISDIIVAGAIGAIFPGAGSTALHGAQAVPKVMTALKALEVLSGRAARTTNRVAKTAAAMARNNEKVVKAVGDTAAEAALAAAGVVLKNEIKEAANNDQPSPSKSPTEDPKPVPQNGENQR
jgi:RHS repeat-associated protein